MNLPPCSRHGVRGTDDPRIVSALEAGSRAAGQPLAELIESMIDFDDQLWTTWRTPRDRADWSEHVDHAWAACGGSLGTRHLVRSDQDYDYQEECMTGAAAPSGKAGDG